jgi:hypothetical protein
VHHVTDEELLLDYYGEATETERAAMRTHLQSCEPCRALDRELRGVLALVDAEPLPAAPAGFEQEMWARVEPHIASVGAGNVGAAFRRPNSAWSFELPRWVLAASAAALAVASFALGRVWDSPSATSATSTADARAVSERMLRSEVEEHLERSQRMLVDLVNADDAAPVALTGDRARAADLVAAGRLYRRSMDSVGDADTRDLLEAVERVLVEIANGPEVETSKDLSAARERISDQDLIFRLRLMTAEMRAREERHRPTW